MPLYGKNIVISLHYRMVMNYEILILNQFTYVCTLCYDYFTKSKPEGSGMKNSDYKLCDNSIRGGGFAHTISASLKRKERKEIWA